MDSRSEMVIYSSCFSVATRVHSLVKCGGRRYSHSVPEVFQLETIRADFHGNLDASRASCDAMSSASLMYR